jgi:hypothetical protein
MVLARDWNSVLAEWLVKNKGAGIALVNRLAGLGLIN